MAEGHGGGRCVSRGSNHPALVSTSAAPPYPRRGASSRTYVTVYRSVRDVPGIPLFSSNFQPQQRIKNPSKSKLEFQS